ncbi:helix-hairpin-helix domain-containing protein [bacterium]|nr:helix-hairpin-helix domain-containing protein [bacterium]
MNFIKALLLMFFTDRKILFAFLEIASLDFRQKTKFIKRVYSLISTAGKYLGTKKKRKKKYLTVSNKNCSICFAKEIEIKDLSQKNTRRYARTVFIKKSARDRIFYETLSALNDKMNYAKLWYIIHECGVTTEEPPKKVTYKTETEIKAKKMIDVNSATLEELSALSGINVILAKKIIKRREDTGGFKDLEDFFRYTKLTENIKKQLYPILKAEKIEKHKTERTEERKIDL